MTRPDRPDRFIIIYLDGFSSCNIHRQSDDRQTDRQGTSVVQLVACWTTDHHYPCSNLGVGISEGYFICDFASLLLEVARPIQHKVAVRHQSSSSLPQTARQTDRQTDRQTNIYIYTYSLTHSSIHLPSECFVGFGGGVNINIFRLTEK